MTACASRRCSATTCARGRARRTSADGVPGTTISTPSPKTRCAPTCTRSRTCARSFRLKWCNSMTAIRRRSGTGIATNAKFPSGLKKLAMEIRACRFHRRESGPRRFLPRAIRNSCASTAPGSSSTARTANRCALDIIPTGPPATTSTPTHSIRVIRRSTAHLERLFRKIVEDFGYQYLKLDFSMRPQPKESAHDPAMTRAETLRRGLEAIRRGAGERTFTPRMWMPARHRGWHRRRHAHRTRRRALLGRNHGRDRRAGHGARVSTRSSRAALCIDASG